jgi:putative transposase
MARVVVPGHPHHVTQKGNRRQNTFFCDDDYPCYIELMSASARKGGTAVWVTPLIPSARYALADQVAPVARAAGITDGHVVVALVENGQARFAGLLGGQALAEDQRVFW